MENIERFRGNRVGGKGVVFSGVKFLGSLKKMFLEKQIHPDFILKNVGHNLQIWALLRT